MYTSTSAEIPDPPYRFFRGSGSETTPYVHTCVPLRHRSHISTSTITLQGHFRLALHKFSPSPCFSVFRTCQLRQLSLLVMHYVITAHVPDLRIGESPQLQEVRPRNMDSDCGRGLGYAPRKFLHALKCARGAPEARACLCMHTVHVMPASCRLRSAVRSKNTTNRPDRVRHCLGGSLHNLVPWGKLLLLPPLPPRLSAAMTALV